MAGHTLLNPSEVKIFGPSNLKRMPYICEDTLGWIKKADLRIGHVIEGKTITTEEELRDALKGVYVGRILADPPAPPAENPPAPLPAHEFQQLLIDRLLQGQTTQGERLHNVEGQLTALRTELADQNTTLGNLVTDFTNFNIDIRNFMGNVNRYMESSRPGSSSSTEPYNSDPSRAANKEGEKTPQP